MKLGIVCGYGIDLNNDIEGYLNFIGDYSALNSIDTLILSGGYTQKNSNTSEAGVMHKIMLSNEIKANIIIEDASITTLHNLTYSKGIIKSLNTTIEKIYIFCDAARIFKVFCISKIILKGYNFQIVYFQRKENPLIYLLQIPSTLIQVLGAIFPRFNQMIIVSRQKWNQFLDKYRHQTQDN